MIKLARKFDNIKSLFYFPSILKKINRIEDCDLFFFFPNWQVGGAEKVHSEIIQEFSSLKPVCFITNNSKNDGFKEKFLSYSSVITLKRWGTKKSYKSLLIPLIAKKINSSKKPTIFGSGSEFFYDLIPHLSENIKIIDLIHAFTNSNFGPETYSIPYINRINYRIILGEKTKTDFINLYKRNNIPSKYIDNLKIIPNKIKSPSAIPDKDYNTNFNIIFVSRNSPEKRPELFIKIANKCIENKLNVIFTMIGPFNHLKSNVSHKINITGEITDTKTLYNYYKNSHLLLLTSEIEGFPMVILEAMSHGVVTISTDVGEIPTYISEEKRNGFIIKDFLNENSIIEKFVEKITFLLENKYLLREFSENAFKLINDEFSEINFSKSYRKLLL